MIKQTTNYSLVFVKVLKILMIIGLGCVGLSLAVVTSTMPATNVWVPRLFSGGFGIIIVSGVLILCVMVWEDKL